MYCSGFPFIQVKANLGKNSLFPLNITNTADCPMSIWLLIRVTATRTSHQVGPLDILSQEEVDTEHPQSQKLQVEHGSCASHLLLIHPKAATPPVRAVQSLQVCRLQPQARNTQAQTEDKTYIHEDSEQFSGTIMLFPAQSFYIN